MVGPYLYLEYPRADGTRGNQNVQKDETREQNHKLLKSLVYAVHTKEVDKALEGLLVSRGESLASMLASISLILTGSDDALVAQTRGKVVKRSSDMDKLLASLVANHLAADIAYRRQFDTYVGRLLSVGADSLGGPNDIS